MNNDKRCVMCENSVLEDGVLNCNLASRPCPNSGACNVTEKDEEDYANRELKVALEKHREDYDGGKLTTQQMLNTLRVFGTMFLDKTN